MPAMPNSAIHAEPSRLPLPVEGSKTTAQRQWVHLLPFGRVRGRDGRRFQLAASKARSVIAATMRQNADRLVIDYEHQTDLAASNGRAAPAAGWMVALEARSDGVWGLVEWTARAKAMIAQREYRYLSPTFLHRSDGEITRIERAALTNDPNLILTALASRGRSTKGKPMDAAEGSTTNEAVPPEIVRMLGLETDATLDTVMETIATLLEARNDAVPDPARYVPVEQIRELIAQNAREPHMPDERSEEVVSAAIASGRLPPALKVWGLAPCRSQPSKFVEYVDTAPNVWRGLTTPLDRQFADDRLAHHRRGSQGEDADAVALQLGLNPSDLDD